MSKKVRVICTRPGASNFINGVTFTEVEPGVRLSDEIDREQAEEFCELSGFVIDGDEPVAPTPVPVPPADEVKEVEEDKVEAPAPAPAPTPKATAVKKKPVAPAPAPTSEEAVDLPPAGDEAF